MKKTRGFYLILAVVIMVVSCRDYKQQAGRIPVAKVGDKVLYYDQIPSFIQPGMTSADSTAAINSYVNRWAKKEILKLKAVLNLTTEFRTEVDKQVDEMRTNLLIHNYQQQMINQKMDTVVEESEIENYYASKASSFTLNGNIVKALFIRIPTDIPGLEKVSEWYRSNNPSDIAQLEVFCFQFADKFDDFKEQWIPMSVLLSELPSIIDNQDDFLKRNSFYETEDAGFRYFVSIREYRLRGTIAPYEYARDNIIGMILNTRRIEFLQELENGIFNEAMRESNLIIYSR